MKSILLGNGIDIQFGGKAYSNRFIMSRVVFNAQTGKYDPLFDGTISGGEIAAIFKGFLPLANDVLAGMYDNLSVEGLSDAIRDFKARFQGKTAFQKYYEIPLEDWFMLMQIFYYNHSDIADQIGSAKQAVERIVLDAIYNDGKIQTLFSSMGKQVRRFFNDFDCVFTLNYDNNIEKLCKRQVFHLHGDFSVPMDCENPQMAQGFCRIASGQCVIVPGFEHCFCNALLDYSGDLKYNRAKMNSDYTSFLNYARSTNRNNDVEYQHAIDTFRKTTPEAIEWINAYCDHPELQAATDYHFSKLSSLTGELHIIGMSPQNDGHIFRCIEASNVDKVVFYRYGSDPIKLPLTKKVEVADVSTLWKRLNACKQKFNCKVNIPDTAKVSDFIKALNALSFDEISREDIIQELTGIPAFLGDPLCEEAISLMESKSEGGPPKDFNDLGKQFMAISQIALREGIYPSAFYMLLINYMNTHGKTK